MTGKLSNILPRYQHRKDMRSTTSSGRMMISGSHLPLEGKHMNIYIHHVVSGRYFKVTSTDDCDRPHLFIKKGSD